MHKKEKRKKKKNHTENVAWSYMIIALHVPHRKILGKTELALPR